MEQKDNLAITEAVRVIDKLLKKYGYKNVNAGALNQVMQELATHGRAWYGVFCEKCHFNEDMLNYPTGRAEYDKLDELEDDADKQMETILNDYGTISIMAVAKTLVEKLNLKYDACNAQVADMFETQAKLSTYCDDVLDSYLEAGVSEYIIKGFALNQNQEYSDKMAEIKDIEAKIIKTDAKAQTVKADATKLDNAINTIETNTYLKYVDPDDKREYVKFKYLQNITKLKDKQDDKVRV